MLLPCCLSIRRLTERWAAAALSLNASISLSPFRSHRPRNGGSIRHDPRTHTVLHYPSSQPTAFGSRLPAPRNRTVPSVCTGPMFACVQKSRVFVPTGASDSAGLSKDSASYLVSLHRHTQTLRERDSGAERERVLSERSIGHFRGFCF